MYATVATESVRASYYDAAADFSPTSNPNGVWSYGWSATLGGALQLYTQSGPDNADSPPAHLLDTWNAGTGGFFAVPAVYHNNSGGVVSFNGGTITFQPGELGFHPGPNNEYSIVRFTAPTSGSYSLASSYSPLDLSTTTDVHVLHNGVSIFDGLVNPGSPTSFGTTFNLIAGDQVDFAVGVGVNGFYSSDTTGLSATLESLSAVPEPTSASLLAAAAAMGYSWRRRRSR